MVNLSAPATKAKRPLVTVAVELSVIAHGSVEFIPGQKATITRNVMTENQAELEFGRPRVMLAVDSSSPDAKQSPALYVIRYLFSR
jgi:hypothetical protein